MASATACDSSADSSPRPCLLHAGSKAARGVPEGGDACDTGRLRLGEDAGGGWVQQRPTGALALSSPAHCFSFTTSIRACAAFIGHILYLVFLLALFVHVISSLAAVTCSCHACGQWRGDACCDDVICSARLQAGLRGRSAPRGAPLFAFRGSRRRRRRALGRLSLNF
jgi:hypothetical protein